MHRIIALVLIIAASARADFTPDVTRTWIGPDYWANRLQDWQLADGAARCLEAGERFPLRTLMHLTTRLGPEPVECALSVRVSETASKAPAADRWCGFLLGSGGEDVDYRLSAQTHHRPAPSGGLLALVDGNGRAHFRSNEIGGSGGNAWSVGGALPDGAAPEFDTAVRRDEAAAPGPWDVDLRVTAINDDFALTLTVRSAATRELISRAVIDGVDAALVEGAIGLVSHRGAHVFEDFVAAGPKCITDETRVYGPILHAMYTISDDLLSISAQFPPLDVAARARFEVEDAGGWRDLGEVAIDEAAWVATTRTSWPGGAGRYRVTYGDATFEGIIREAPEDGSFRLGALTCNKIFTGGLRWDHDGLWMPHADLAAHVAHHDPDLLYFAGDQIYEGDLDPAERRDQRRARLDYLMKWYRFGWSFRDLMRDRPTITVPDDHDVWHGNIWGAGGRKAVATEIDGRRVSAQDAGGYKMSPEFVNAVHMTQTAHLPPPVDPEPIDRGISVWFTRLDWGGVSFAITSDRMFKSAPARFVPDGLVTNGWFQAEDFDPMTQADAPEALLFGPRQLAFLESWAIDYANDTWMKVLLSQSPLANIATLPEGAKSGGVIPSLPILEPGEYPPNHAPAADCDSGGWPPSGRNRALEAIRRGFAIHVAGDQHLASLVQYGIGQWNNGAYGFSVPAIANTWPRRWQPKEPGNARFPGMPRYTGNYRDGFGNHMTVYAIANPVRTGKTPARLHDRVPGYGIVDFDRKARAITFGCWPRSEDPASPDARQYEGWPRTISIIDNAPPRPRGWLPQLVLEGEGEPVIEVINESTGEIEYALRCNAPRFRPWIVDEFSRYTVRVGNPDTDSWTVVKGLVPAEPDAREVEIRWD